MANLSGDVRLLEEYEQEIDDLFERVTGDAKADVKIQKEIDKKMPIYLKQAQLVRSEFPESNAGAIHESNYHVFRAMRTAFSSVLARRIAQGSNLGVKGLAAAGIANAQEKANGAKAVAILDEALAVCDTAFARFQKAHFLEIIGRKEEAMNDLRYLIKNFPDSDDIYVAARKRLDALENPPKKGPCFVATACYGDYNHPDVRLLRRWRDERLLPSKGGRLLVRVYYGLGPKLATRIERSPRVSGFVRRRLLKPFANRLRD